MHGGGVILSTLALLLVIIDNYNGRVDINRCNFGNNILCFYATGIIGTSIIIGLCHTVKDISVRNYIVGSMLVIGFNLIVIGYVKWIFEIIDKPISLHLALIIGITILLLFYPIIIVCNKYFPAILGFRK